MKAKSIKRQLLTMLAPVAAVAALIALLGAGGSDSDDGTYKVRAVFDNASFIIPGEDVKVAGFKVGKIDDVDLTAENKAAVVLAIEDEAFVPFRADASCTIRVQSLIGEQFIECEPSTAHKTGAPLPEPLEQIEDGEGEGQHLLPVEGTQTPVPVDLINNMQRLPERQRLRLLINEFGAGLAGNGPELRDAIRRANPAIKEFGQVVEILAAQDKLLGRLVDESEQVLEPMAERREQFTGFVRHSGNAAAAAASEGDALEENFEKFPAFLRELGPSADRFAELADQMQPALATLEAEAPAINASVEGLGPFSEASLPALVSLGKVADQGRKSLPKIDPLLDEATELGRPLEPATGDLADLFTSLDDRGGVEELMRLIYFYTGATNGVDALGHYLRGAVQIGCERLDEVAFGCESNFDSSGETSSAAKARVQQSAIARAAAEAVAPEGIDQVTPLLDFLLSPEDAPAGSVEQTDPPDVEVDR